MLKKRYGLIFYPKRCSWIIQAFMTVILLETGKQEEVFMDILSNSVEYQLHGKAKA